MAAVVVAAVAVVVVVAVAMHADTHSRRQSWTSHLNAEV